MDDAVLISLSQYSKSKLIYVNHESIRSNYKSFQNDCYMAVYTAHGSGLIEVMGKRMSVTEGDIFLIPPNTPYRFVPNKNILKIDIYFCYFAPKTIDKSWKNFHEEFSNLSDFFNNKDCVYAIDTDKLEIRDIFIRMIDEQFSIKKCGYDLIIAYLSMLLIKIFRNTKTRDFKRIYSQNSTIDELIRTVYRDLYTDISLNKLAEHLGKSPSFICRTFKKHMGMTTSQFINLLRVEKIKDSLKNTNKPIKNICEMFHFHPEYLKRIFREETGMSMTEYRKKYHYN